MSVCAIPQISYVCVCTWVQLWYAECDLLWYLNWIIHECTQTEMMHKQSRDYTEDLWGQLSIKIQKTNTNIHHLMPRLNMLHWLRAHPSSLCERVRDGGRKKERKKEKERGSTRAQRGLVWCFIMIKFVSKLSEWVQVWASEDAGKENWLRCFCRGF